MKADRGDSGSEIGLGNPEGDPDPENDLSPPPSAYPGRWAAGVLLSELYVREKDMSIHLIIGLCISVVVFALLYKPFFGKENDFWECIYTAISNRSIFPHLNNLPPQKRDYGKAMKATICLVLVVFAGLLGQGIFTQLIK